MPDGYSYAASENDIRLNSRVTYGEQQDYIDNSWEPSPDPWNHEMTHDDYHVKIKEDFTSGQVVQFSKGTDTVAFQPMALEWTNDLDQIQPIEMPNDVVPIVDTNETELEKGVINYQGYVRWNDAYGTGIDFKWECSPGTLEKRLIIDSLANLPAPEQYMGDNVSLRLNLIFDPTTDLLIWVDGELWGKNSQVQTFSHIQFTRDGQTVFSFKPLQYWSSDPVQDGESVATLDKKGNSLYISILVPYEWLQTAVYPVYIDADVTIDAAAHIVVHDIQTSRCGPFWVSTTTAYIIYIESGTTIVYNKTGDGGDTWGGQVTIESSTSIYVDCFPDWQVDGDAGTKIHIVYADYANDDIKYIYLDTDGDSVGGEKVIYDGTIVQVSGWDRNQLSITKSRGGTYYISVKYVDASEGAIYAFYSSPDADTWTSKTSPWEADSDDYLLLFPANLADDDDIWGVFWDASASIISLKTYDNSSNDWTSEAAEANIATGMTIDNTYFDMDGQIRLSDGHLIFAAWSSEDDGAQDLRVFDITNAGTITEKTTIYTNKADYGYVSVFVNQVNDDIYIAYFGGSSLKATVKCFYELSTDGGANWQGSDQAMQADAEDDSRWVSAGCIKAAWGGKFMPIWHNADLYDIFCNTDNAVSIAASGGAAAPSVTTGSASNIDCNSFDVWGVITDNNSGTTTTVGFYYGIGALTANVTDTYSTDNFTLNIASLNDNTEYMVQAFAINEYGIGTGDTENFTTLASSDPTVTTDNATNITNTTARLNATISGLDCDDADDTFWEWGLSTGNYTANYTDTTDHSNGAVYHDISGLSANTTYFYRACARLNGGAYQCGAEISFNTTSICHAPTELRLKILTGNRISAEWDSVANVTSYFLLISNVDYPDDPDNPYGYAVAYSGNDTSAILEGYYTDYTEYFFSLWTLCNPYSDDYVTASIGGESMDTLAVSFQNLGILTISMIPLIFFSVMAFWKENSVMFMLAAGVAILVGFNCYDVETSTWMLGISLVLWVYSIACLIFGLMCMFKGGRQIDSSKEK